MRGKRSKQYRKLMQQYGMTYGFREPYQVLVDAEIVRDADRFKMDLLGGLERTLHGQVKPMITQCSMRHLYAAASEPGVSYLIDKAKTFERRRCGHLPEEYPEPLSATECLSAVVDPKSSKNNKHRYVVASQDIEVRKAMRGILGVPLVYINRSVMIMEPMADASVETREKGERGKFRDGLKRGSGSVGMKRKRGDDEEEGKPAGAGEDAPKKKKKFGAPKGPNPLAVKKSKKKVEGEGVKAPRKEGEGQKKTDGPAAEAAGDEASNPDAKKKRRRKHKSAAAGAGEEGAADAAPADTVMGDASS